MRQLIERKQDFGIECDNVNCDFKIPFSEEEEKVMYKYIDMPCPKCGENLLTEKDYILYLKVLKVVAWLNKWFSWTTYIYSKKSWDKRKSIIVKVHDGIKVKE